VKVSPHFNGFWQRVGRTSPTGTSQSLDPIGGGAGLDLTIGDFKIGGGGSFEHGTNLYVVFVGSETIDGSGALRDGTSFYADAMYTVGPVDLSAGYGQSGIKRTTFDEANNLNINKVQSNIHGAIQYHIAPLTLVAELNVLHHEWYLGNTQNVQVVSLGADFVY
jgi:predicted porin